MKRSDIDRSRDAQAFADLAVLNAGALDAAALAEAEQPQHAVLYDLVIVGEAVSKVSPEIRAAAPAIDWRDISDFRNYIVHSYWQIDFEIVAGVIRNELSVLIEELDRLIPLVERL